MGLKADVIPFHGWPSALRIGNGVAELVVTLDVGPRILSYTLPGAVNPFNVYEDQAGGVGENVWRNRGGHRLWLAPESPDFSYFPDNGPVAWERRGEFGVRLTPAPEPGPGFQKQIDLVMDPAGAGVTVTHRISRTGGAPCVAAPWALSVMAAGGIAVIPQPAMGEHPRDLLPNRRLVLWPYTDLTDPRYRFGRSFFTLRQDVNRGPTKIGLVSKAGWAGYLVKGTLFVKRFIHASGAQYPDDGCNLEVFTNARMLELESLGPLKRMAAGESAELVEHWDLLAQQPQFSPSEGEALESHFLLVQKRLFSNT